MLGRGIAHILIHQYVCVILNAIWSAPPTAALWLSAERLVRVALRLKLSVPKRAKAAALPPHSKSLNALMYKGVAKC